MEIFRICPEKWVVMTASGVENRWNKSGEYVIYCGGSRSLSTLELVVHRASIITSKKYKLMVLYLKSKPGLIEEIQVTSLPPDWRNRSAYSVLQELGSDWYNSRRSLILKVPSAVVPQEFNYLINTTHPDFASEVSHIDTEDYFWDSRLI